MTVYVCQPTLEGILCGIYDAWMSRLGHENVRLQLKDVGNLTLFCEYRKPEESEEKIRKVADAVKLKISGLAFHWLCSASLSFDEDRADKMYRFLIDGFRLGSQVTKALQLPSVHEIFKLVRHVGNEAHLLTGFVRFSEMSGGILFSKIGPKNDVLAVIVPHFADRLRTERFILYDVIRKKAAAYSPGEGWTLFQVEGKDLQAQLEAETDGKEYEDLWRIFHQAVSIRERENYVCQRTNLPLRYRPYMTEFLQNYKD